MVSQITSILTEMLSSCSQWMVALFDSTSAGYVYLGILSVVIVINFLILPAFKGSTPAIYEFGSKSDYSRKSGNQSNKSKSLTVVKD